MNVRDIIARSDACQATRAPVIEHVKTSPAGANAGPKRKVKAKYDAQAFQDLVREADRLAYAERKAAGSLQQHCWTVGLKSCQSSSSLAILGSRPFRPLEQRSPASVSVSHPSGQTKLKCPTHVVALLAAPTHGLPTKRVGGAKLATQ